MLHVRTRTLCTSLVAGCFSVITVAVWAGGPTFTALVPSVELEDTNDLHQWGLCGDGDGSGVGCFSPSAANQAFKIGYNDATNNGNPFVIEFLAPTSSIHIDSSGFVGMGTSAPATELEVQNLSSPSEIRLTTSGADSWDLGSFDSGTLGFFQDNFSLEDVGASQFPFQVMEGADTGSLFVGSTGNIGNGPGIFSSSIFTPNPGEAVDVQRSAAAARFQLTSFTNTGSEAPQFVQRRARGTSGTPTAVTNGSNLGLFSFRGHTGSAFTGSKAAITVQATQTWTGSANGTQIIFATTPNNSTTLTNVMTITNNGQVRINGITLNVPDYVFEEDYDLMPLEDLKAYIAKEKHLPNMPSSAEVKREGVDLGGSQMALLEKVEELTLYTLRQHEEIQELRSERRDLEDRLAVLEKTISVLSQRQ